MNIAQEKMQYFDGRLEQCFRNYRKRFVIGYNSKHITYEDFLSLVNKRRTEFNIDVGAVVILHGKNSIDMLAAAFAVIMSHGIIVPVNENSTLDEIDEIVRKVSPHIAIADKDLISRYMAIYKKTCYRVCEMDGYSAFVYPVSFYNQIHENIKMGINHCAFEGIIYYTSKMQGIFYSFNSYMYMASRINCTVDNNMMDVILCQSNRSFEDIFLWMLVAIEVGAEIIIDERDRDTRLIPDIINEYGITGWNNSSISNVEVDNLLRYIMVWREFGERIKDRNSINLPINTKIYYMYGVDECKCVSVISNNDKAYVARTYGKPISGSFFVVTSKETLDKGVLLYGTHLAERINDEMKHSDIKVSISDERGKCVWIPGVYDLDETGYINVI